MKLFLDTAVIDEIEQGAALGFIDGVTTNPALLSKQNMKYKQAIQKISSIIKDGTIFAEVLADKAEKMAAEAFELVTWAPNICIKIPMIPEGIKAVPLIKKKNIPVTVTLIYTPAQAMIAHKSGADFVAPFIARSNEYGQDGIALIEDIAAIYRTHDVKTQILAASIRTAVDATKALAAGADSLTVPYPVVLQMMASPNTDLTLNTFLKLYQEKNIGSII
jgi:transaldolase